MEAEGINPSAISAFESTFKSLVSGDSGMIPESTISPVQDLANAKDFKDDVDTSLLSKTVMLKLNGGLGTSMGLDKAKSLLKVKGEDTFLDLTAKQVIQMRKDYGMKVKFMLMDSFSTSGDTMKFLSEKYPALAGEDGLEMMQNKVPKLDATTYEVGSRCFFSVIGLRCELFFCSFVIRFSSPNLIRFSFTLFWQYMFVFQACYLPIQSR